MNNFMAEIQARKAAAAAAKANWYKNSETIGRYKHDEMIYRKQLNWTHLINKQSNIIVSKYSINTNSREMILNNQKLKLTEKEINMILYLTQSKKPIKINELQEKVWGYQSKLETHTVETHIHRLRKKIKEKFFDENLIISKKNGYEISEKK